jgi:ABC-2 type transport system permease protein
MRSRELVKRNFKAMWRDWLSLGVNVGLPILLLLVLQALEGVDDFFAPSSLAPGVAVFGFVMLTMTSAMLLAQDRESSLFARLLTTPLQANDFVFAYSVPYVAVAVIQAIVVFAVAIPLGLSIEGNVLWVIVTLLLLAILYVGFGMLIGAVTPYKAVTGPWVVVMLLTIFGGTWVNLEDIGGVFETVADVFPFAHGLAAIRGVMLDGAGFGDIAADLVWVLVYTVAVVIIAVAVFRRRMVE